MRMATSEIPWRVLNRLSAYVILVGLGAPVWGEPRRPGAPSEEILITGERQRESIPQVIQVGSFRGATQLNTPSTVSVITDETMRSQQDQSLAEALRNSSGVTGLLVSPSVYTNASIRGVPVNGRTNIKLNGSLSVVNFIETPLENKARIEVLKGVSALYYGFATPSGIINLVARSAPISPELRVSISSNQFGQIQTTAEAGTTMGILGFRTTIVAGTVRSGIRRTTGDRQLQAGNISIQPSDALTFDLVVEHIGKDVTEPTILQGPKRRAFLLTQLPQLPDPQDNSGSKGFVNRARELNLLVRGRWIITPQWTVTTEGGFSNARRDRRFSILGNFDSITGLGQLTVQASDGQLFRNSMLRSDLSGNVETGAISHYLIVGVSRQRSRQYFTAPRVVADPTNPDGCVELGIGLDCVQNAFHPTALRDIDFDGRTPFDPNRDTKNLDTGFYAFDRLGLGGGAHDRLNLILGIRKSVYREYVASDRYHWRRTFAANPTTFSAAGIYRPRSNVSLYASYIQGIESEPPAPNLTVNQGEILPPGKSTQWELGAKVSPNQSLLLNVAYFDIRRRLTYVNSDNRFVDDGNGYYGGVEAGIAGKVTSDLSVVGSATLLDAREAVPGDRAIDGKRVEDSAHWQWSLFGEYRPSKWLRGVGLSGGIFFVGRRPINPENSLFVPGYTTLDIGASYTLRIAGLSTIVRLNVNNLLAKRYVASTGSNVFAMGMPRTIRLTLTTKVL